MNDRKENKIGLIVPTVICGFLIIFQVLSLSNGLSAGSTLEIFRSAFDLLITSLIIIYTFIGYDKPHGNMLRTVFFIFGIYLSIFSVLLFDIYAVKKLFVYLSAGGMLLAALTITYVAGRLDKIEKDRILLIFAGLMIIMSNIIGQVFLSPKEITVFAKVSFIIASLTPLFSLIALSFSYAVRYREHKSAGLQENT